MPIRIGISLGDVTGIGPEVVLKALAEELNSDDNSYVLIGDARVVRELNQRLQLNLRIGASDTGGKERIILSEAVTEPLPAGLAQGAAPAALAAVEWVRTGARM